MKKLVSLIAIITLLSGIIVSCNQKPQKKKVYYTCPMHPKIKSDTPAKCLLCGDMDLEKVEE